MTTTNVELINMAKFYKVHLHGVYMRDEIVNMRPEVGNYIVNLNTSGQSGSHWVGIMCTDQFCFYFDSYGVSCPKEVDYFIRKRYIKYGTNTKEIQAITSKMCGFFVLGLFIFVKNISINGFYDTCNAYTNIFELNRQLNDLVIRKFFRDIKPKSPIAIKILHI